MLTILAIAMKYNSLPKMTCGGQRMEETLLSFHYPHSSLNGTDLRPGRTGAIKAGSASIYGSENSEISMVCIASSTGAKLSQPSKT